MGPSNDFRQGRLPFDARKPVHREARAMWLAEQHRIEDMRASFIDQICDRYREGGSELKLIRPNGDPNLHLFCNGKFVGVFVEEKSGLVFRQHKGE